MVVSRLLQPPLDSKKHPVMPKTRFSISQTFTFSFFHADRVLPRTSISVLLVRRKSIEIDVCILCYLYWRVYGSNFPERHIIANGVKFLRTTRLRLQRRQRGAMPRTPPLFVPRGGMAVSELAIRRFFRRPKRFAVFRGARETLNDFEKSAALSPDPGRTALQQMRERRTPSAVCPPLQCRRARVTSSASWRDERRVVGDGGVSRSRLVFGSPNPDNDDDGTLSGVYAILPPAAGLYNPFRPV